MTTSQEKAALAKFVDSLPDASYLKPLLATIKGEIDQAIDNDFAFVDWAGRVQAQQEQAEEIKRLSIREQELRQQVAAKEREAARWDTRIDNFKSEARLLAMAVNGR